jgi:hypothetical protein
MSCEDGGGDQRNAAPRIACNSRKLEEIHEQICPLDFQMEDGPANLIFHFWTPELCEKTFLLLFLSLLLLLLLQ